MSNNLAIKLLLSKREALLSEKSGAMARFDTEIGEIETALAELTGKKVWEMTSETLYDDEHPDYIKASEEEI